MKKNQLSWKEAFTSGPGPKDLKQTVILMIKGFIMGVADIIPGVSGGTIAFITGIYHQLVSGIASIDKIFISYLLKFEFKQSINYFHTRFIFPLAFGVGSAIILMAAPMHYFLNYHKSSTLSLFFGLLAASIYVLLKEIDNPTRPINLFSILIGLFIGYFIVGLIPIQTPNNWAFIMFCGAIAATAMILPGISGAFILLILGKYEYITGTLKNPFELQNFLTIIIFVSGVVIGLTGFSKFLKYLLEHKKRPTLCILVGLMIGAMRKIWPWKVIARTKIIANKEYILQEMNILPNQFSSSIVLSLGLMIIGIILVVLIQKLSKNH